MMVNPVAPWRAVVSTTKVGGSSRQGSNRHLYADNILECGHRFEVRGEKALDAKFAKRRRCKKCYFSIEPLKEGSQ